MVLSGVSSSGAVLARGGRSSSPAVELLQGWIEDSLNQSQQL